MNAVVLWIHLFSAVLFVGGSFFFWIVVMPLSHTITDDESKRTQIIGKMAKRFALITNPVLVVLVLSGIYNASWYLQDWADPFRTLSGELLFAKVVLVVILIALIYLHGVYYGRKIVRLAEEKRVEELDRLRRHSRIVSYANLGLMLAVTVLAVLLQIPP